MSYLKSIQMGEDVTNKVKADAAAPVTSNKMAPPSEISRKEAPLETSSESDNATQGNTRQRKWATMRTAKAENTSTLSNAKGLGKLYFPFSVICFYMTNLLIWSIIFIE